ncbi:hypothetical protein [Bacillus seohaeanensis]|jgi:hypothetical protein|uniref:Uncharacterized protein n=1 Tax=Bacillus seohaeanensis TaxID=284580 RepID=A0ABW5RKJ3_9BACI
MNKNLSNMAHKAKTTLNQASSFVKEKVFSMTGTSWSTVKDLAEYIQQHPDTITSNKSYLNLNFSFYQLNVEDVHFYLEMRGSHILQLNVLTKDHSVVSYRSYRDHYTLDTPIKVPQLSSE